MSKTRFWPAAMLLPALLVAAGCEGGASANNRDKQAADVAAAQARADQSQASIAAKKAMQSRLKELELRIDALKAESHPATAKAERESGDSVKQLEDQVAELRAKLSTEQGRTQEWDKLKDATEADFKKIEQKLDDMMPSKK